MQPVILLDRISSDEMKKHLATADEATSVRPAKVPRQQKPSKKVLNGQTIAENDVSTKPTHDAKPSPVKAARVLRKRNA